MPIDVIIKNAPVRINTEAIDHDIEQLDPENRNERDLRTLLTCLRDWRKYDPVEIEAVCYVACPHYAKTLRGADDTLLLTDCKRLVHEGKSLDGTPYFSSKDT